VRQPGQQWERFGRVDPYYGVCSTDEFRESNFDDAARERFFASGREHVDRMLAIASELRPGFSPETVLDHGCGVGRLVVAFAEHAERVFGVDVSPSMLAEARRNCDARGLGNVELTTADRLDGLRPEFDLVHSFIVMQHIPRKDGEQAFRSLVGLVRPGGIGIVHVPLAALHWTALVHTAVTRIAPFAYNAANLVRRRPWDYPHMQMNVYRLNTLAQTLLDAGIEDVQLRMHPGVRGAAYASALLVFERPASARS
jgi:ubiquinone/menaquinone biosynthesis C-methylase UbiE